ncbi:hypothetical protein POM88_027952 [Heracleum sosnowskyi]|uniref:Uncharacterized protein n=1 Tax=Heracleum sosnowskyi TaxID=360622 RepID=A0AAD8IB67_9APIA|nr:hypothetical protein POM88_027952 [Heracleum sosnowskyi]
MVGLAVAVLVLVVLLARYFTGHSKDTKDSPKYVHGKTSLSDAVDGAIKIFTVAVTIVVVAVPEGLPLAVRLTTVQLIIFSSRISMFNVILLAYSMRKMMADKDLMTVVETYICREKIDPSEKRSLPPKVASLLIEGVAQNTTGSVFMSENYIVHHFRIF